MPKIFISFLALGFLFAGAPPATAHQDRVSPHETISRVIDGNRVMIVYGRPYTVHPHTGEKRVIWGGLVPYDEVWRTGANEATLLITQQPIDLGGTLVPAGAYTLFTLPQADGTAKLIVNRQIGQGGHQYDEKQDLARISLERETLDEPVEQFKISIEPASAGGGVLKLMWENTQFSVPFSVRK